jgi:hypothetical protein
LDIGAANRYTVRRLETAVTPRGTLVRGVFLMPLSKGRFQVPQQGRYQASLRLPKVAS